MTGFATILVPVTDLPAARAFYVALVGDAPFMDESYYVAFQCGDIHLGLNPHGKPGVGGTVVYWDTADIQDLSARLVNAGGAVIEAPHDVGAGNWWAR